MESKAQLRKRIKGIRNSLTENERITYSRQISEQLLRQPWYESSEEILVYSAIQSEVDLSVFCKQAWLDGKMLYFPKVFGDHMVFFLVRDEQQLCSGAFGVMEPDVEHVSLPLYLPSGNVVPMLVPGVAFSKKGDRIGYGKGYYDRYMVRHPEVNTVGICFTCQLLDDIPAESQDIAMHQIVTEEQIYSL